jgi:hypothetical protein
MRSALQRFWAEWSWPLQVFLLTRLALLGAAFFADIALPGPPEAAGRLEPSNLWLDVWARWDSGFYLHIATQGYYLYPDEPSAVAFFPLYPLLLKGLAGLVGNAVLAGVLLSHLSFALALMVLWKLSLQLLNSPAAARRAVLYLAIFPTSFYFSAVYTESLSLLWVLLAFYALHERRWEWAAVSAALASATRVTGILLAGVLWLEYLRAWEGRSRWPVGLALAGVGSLGLLSYMAFLAVQFGDPLAFWSVQGSFSREVGGFIGEIRPLFQQNFLTGPISWNVLLDLLALVFGVVGSLVAARRLGLGYALFGLLSLLIPFSSGTGSLSRYVLMVFPAFMVLAEAAERPWLDSLIRFIFPLLLGLLLAIHVNGLFVA